MRIRLSVRPIRSSLLSVFLFLAIFTSMRAQEPRDASPTELALILMRQGMELRYAGEMDSAIALYHRALAIDPENPNVLYELGLSYFHTGDWDESLKYCRRGVAYESELREQFYTIIGSCYDNQKKPEQAIEAYTKGIEISPRAPMLRYNLAVTYANMGKLSEAEQAIKDELLVNPDHASSHFLLTILYGARKERIPALMAAARFLVLEPEGPRSTNALRTMQAVLAEGIRKSSTHEEGKADVSILFDMSESKEGDFKGVELMLTMVTANNLNDSIPNTEFENLREVLDMTFGLLGEQGGSKKMGKGFAVEYYVPYYAELHAGGTSRRIPDHDPDESRRSGRNGMAEG